MQEKQGFIRKINFLVRGLKGELAMPMGLYIHVPFCMKKCHYCDFVSFVWEPAGIALYLQCLEKEMALYGALLSAEEKKITTLYVGGGTPSCLSVTQLEELLAHVHCYFDLSQCQECSVEANPGTLTEEKLLRLRQGGFNRLSLGVQACQDEQLQVLGRIHCFQEALEAVDMAQRAGFTDINADFIFGIPGQTLSQWEACLDTMIRWHLPHVSVYGLQVEAGTPLAQRVAAGDVLICDEDLEADMFAAAIDTLTQHGYEQYEISNYALPGRECRHNIGYWRHYPYLGLGPAAHSYLQGKRFFNPPTLEAYQNNMNQGHVALEEGILLTQEESMSEEIFLGLRLLSGVDVSGFQERYGERVEDVYKEQIQQLVGEGLLQIGPGMMRLTRRGVELGNRVFSAFI